MMYHVSTVADLEAEKGGGIASAVARVYNNGGLGLGTWGLKAQS